MVSKKMAVLAATLGSAGAIGTGTIVYYKYLTRPPASPPPPDPTACQRERSSWVSAGRLSRFEPTAGEQLAMADRIRQLQQVYGTVFNLSPLTFKERAGNPPVEANFRVIPVSYDFPDGQSKMPFVGYLCLMESTDKSVADCYGGWTVYSLPGISSIRIPDSLPSYDSGGNAISQDVAVVSVAGGHINHASIYATDVVGTSTAGTYPAKNVVLPFGVVAQKYHWVYNDGGSLGTKSTDATSRNEMDCKADIAQTEGTGNVVNPSAVMQPVLYLGGSPAPSKPDWINKCPDIYAEAFFRAYGRYPIGYEDMIAKGYHVKMAPQAGDGNGKKGQSVMDWEAVL